jgi:hypothetical protein
MLRKFLQKARKNTTSPPSSDEGFGVAPPAPPTRTPPQVDELCTAEEVTQKAEDFLGVPVDSGRMALALSAFTECGSDRVNATLFFDAGFSDFVSSGPESKSLFVGQAVMLTSTERPNGNPEVHALLGKILKHPHCQSLSNLLSVVCAKVSSERTRQRRKKGPLSIPSRP